MAPAIRGTNEEEITHLATRENYIRIFRGDPDAATHFARMCHDAAHERNNLPAHAVAVEEGLLEPEAAYWLWLIRNARAFMGTNSTQPTIVSFH